MSNQGKHREKGKTEYYWTESRVSNWVNTGKLRPAVGALRGGNRHEKESPTLERNGRHTLLSKKEIRRANGKFVRRINE